jgi:hypothetical protein
MDIFIHFSKIKFKVFAPFDVTIKRTLIGANIRRARTCNVPNGKFWMGKCNSNNVPMCVCVWRIMGVNKLITKKETPINGMSFLSFFAAPRSIEAICNIAIHWPM